MHETVFLGFSSSVATRTRLRLQLASQPERLQRQRCENVQSNVARLVLRCTAEYCKMSVQMQGFLWTQHIRNYGTDCTVEDSLWRPGVENVEGADRQSESRSAGLFVQKVVRPH